MCAPCLLQDCFRQLHPFSSFVTSLPPALPMQFTLLTLTMSGEVTTAAVSYLAWTLPRLLCNFCSLSQKSLTMADLVQIQLPTASQVLQVPEWCWPYGVLLKEHCLPPRQMWKMFSSSLLAAFSYLALMLLCSQFFIVILGNLLFKIGCQNSNTAS